MVFFSDEAYQAIVKVGGPGQKNHPAASHKMVYHYQTLTELFVSAGFKVNLLEFFDENGIFHELKVSPQMFMYIIKKNIHMLI